ncbi:hypothetical protein K4F52_009381 [Lecanicillium sp. MT-2017a]|nr:hypothetical protein K4F52_009381 [Lecanicillium sp. MT-2017a]
MDTDSIDTLPDIPKPHAAHYQFRSGPRRKWQSRRHEIRARAKDFANSSDHATCADYGLECYSRVRGRGTSLAAQHPSARYHHFYEDLKYTSRFNPYILDTAETGLKFERRSEGRTKSYPRCASNDLDEAVDLAHSGIPLPGDGHHQRRPSLEREDAFYDGTTARGNVKVRTQARPTDDAEIAELYQMGLLYNSGEVDRGTFDINSIRHDEPTYIIRPSKRARKNAKAKGYTLEQPLHLDLSFSDIGDDEAIVRYLMALTDPGDSPEGAVDEETQQSSPPLRVIYELAGSQGSVDIDASQPPDLILDSLSEYDTLPDSEVQPPSQREETMPDADPTDAWVILGDDS